MPKPMARDDSDKTDIQTQQPTPADRPEPRGNPEPDQEIVEKGKEQLDKVSGN